MGAHTQPEVDDRANMAQKLTRRKRGKSVTEMRALVAEPNTNEINASFPVLRRAQLLLAREHAERRIHTFTYEQGERAVALIGDRKDIFHKSIRSGLRKGLIELGFSEKCVLARPPVYLATSRAARNSSLGAVYDFDDIALDLNGAWLVLCRVCLTVCVDQDFFSTREETSNKSHSKVWARFILVERGGELAKSVCRSDLVTFNAHCSEVAQHVVTHVVPAYREVVSEIATKQLKVEKKQSLAFLTTGVDNEHYARASEQLAQGRTFAQLIAARDPVGLHMHGVASEIFGPDALDDSTSQFLAYRNALGDNALYLARFQDTGAQFIGVTASRLDGDALKSGIMRPASFAANAASAGISMEYGARF